MREGQILSLSQLRHYDYCKRLSILGEPLIPNCLNGLDAVGGQSGTGYSAPGLGEREIVCPLAGSSLERRTPCALAGGWCIFRLKLRPLDDRIAGMFDSLQPGDEAATTTLRQCSWAYGTYGVLGGFGVPIALFWKRGPSHLLLLAAACFFVMSALALWFLNDAIKKGPPTQRKLNRRMTLLMLLALAPETVNFLMM